MSRQLECLGTRLECFCATIDWGSTNDALAPSQGTVRCFGTIAGQAWKQTMHYMLLYHVASMSMLFASEGFSNLDVLVFSFPVAAVQSLLASSAIIFAVNAVLHCFHQPRHRAQVSVQCSRVDTEADHDESDDIRRRRFWHCRNAKVI